MNAVLPRLRLILRATVVVTQDSSEPKNVGKGVCRLSCIGTQLTSLSTARNFGEDLFLARLHSKYCISMSRSFVHWHFFVMQTLSNVPIPIFEFHGHRTFSLFHTRVKSEPSSDFWVSRNPPRSLSFPPSLLTYTARSITNATT